MYLLHHVTFGNFYRISDLDWFVNLITNIVSKLMPERIKAMFNCCCSLGFKTIFIYTVFFHNKFENF